MQESWYTWRIKGEVYQRDDLNAFRVTIMGDRPRSFIPYSFQMDEKTMQLLLRKILRGRGQGEVSMAGDGDFGPDLCFGPRNTPRFEWFELKDEKIDLRTRANTTSGPTLREQVTTYRRTKPWEKLQANVVGYAIEEPWDSPLVVFHALQPMILPDGRAALRLLWDVRGDDIMGPESVNAFETVTIRI